MGKVKSERAGRNFLLRRSLHVFQRNLSHHPLLLRFVLVDIDLPVVLFGICKFGVFFFLLWFLVNEVGQLGGRSFLKL